MVLDTDIGTDIDDAWALGYAVNSPVFQLVGVTVTDADTAQRARLAAKLLHRLGRTDVPVAAGRRTAAVPPDRVDYQFTWAEDWPTSPVYAGRQVSRRPGAQNPGEVTLDCGGTAAEPWRSGAPASDVVPLVKRVVLMSGSVGPNY